MGSPALGRRRLAGTVRLLRAVVRTRGGRSPRLCGCWASGIGPPDHSASVGHGPEACVLIRGGVGWPEEEPAVRREGLATVPVKLACRRRQEIDRDVATHNQVHI